MNTKARTIFLSVLNSAAFVIIALVACSADADIWIEAGDAHHLLPGQITLGNGSLDRVDGTISNADFDPDVYCIRIDDPDNFSATTVGSSIGNLSLWLFNEDGKGVSHDGADDVAGGPNSG